MAIKLVGPTAAANPTDAANKLYVDAHGLEYLAAWSDLDTLTASNTRVGLVGPNVADFGAATGIAKYDDWDPGDLWFESHGSYVTVDYFSAQVQRVWVPNSDGTVDEIRRSRDDDPGYSMSAWSAWAIYTPSGGSGIPATTIDAKGDLLAGTANDTVARLAVGADGLALVADSGATPGLSYRAANRYVGINAQTGTTYTPVLSDEGKLVTCNNAGAITVTLPQNSSLAFPIGGSFDVAVIGAGLVTFANDGTSTILATPSAVMRATGSVATAIKISTNGWLVTGDLT